MNDASRDTMTTVIAAPVNGNATADLPPCQAACPVGTDIPNYAALIWNGQLEAAVETITATNPFSTICGRVCPAPCEAGCKRGESDGAVTIRQLKRFVMDRLGSNYHLPPVGVTRPETIAVVGSGPAGLTAAQDLAEAGYAVNVYEQSDRLGGMMNAIPRFRLPAALIQQDIQRILDHCPGITVHLNTGLGDHVDLEALKAKHAAVLLAIGLCKERTLTVAGLSPDLEGVHGVQWLERISRGETLPLAGPTVVVGGGNVAMDMARAALRHGSEQVDLYCLESRAQMPAWAHEIALAEAEGVNIHNGWGPGEVLMENGAVAGVVFQRCTSVFDADGRFSPTFSTDTHTQPAAHLFLAIGLEADNAELADRGLLVQGRVPTVEPLGRTADPMVFAAGDCTYGPSAIVQAMHQGHKAAYAIRAFLERVQDPAVYRPVYRSRQVPLAQEPAWETLPRETQTPAEPGAAARIDAECETAFDPGMARRQAARCLRCDAETGTANYSRRARNLIQAMACTPYDDALKQGALLHALLQPRENPFPPGRPAHIDDVVFLSAALTRLVIDPYREACATRTRITRSREVGALQDRGPAMVLEHPFLCTGFDDAPEPIRLALARGLAESGCGYVGRTPLIDLSLRADPALQWLQLVSAHDTPSPVATGVIHLLGNTFRPVSLHRSHPEQLLGLCVSAPALAAAIPWALEHQLDLLLLDGTAGINAPWSEMDGHPDLTVMRDAIHILRKLNMEEEIALLYFGGMRSGTDVAKALALNCNAVVFGVAIALALGAHIVGEEIIFEETSGSADLQRALLHWIKGTSQETAI
ncbi:MAG: FAD-dependent oxidoreductase, partial [Desulfatitalea sp.]|nr:FAD-dependent oxidoreductase [Desulfatitalea sp.]